MGTTRFRALSVAVVNSSLTMSATIVDIVGQQRVAGSQTGVRARISRGSAAGKTPGAASRSRESDSRPSGLMQKTLAAGWRLPRNEGIFFPYRDQQGDTPGVRV